QAAECRNPDADLASTELGERKHPGTDHDGVPSVLEPHRRGRGIAGHGGPQYHEGARLPSGRPMRLVLVTQDFPPARGGIQTWALEIARRLSGRCEKLAIIAPAADGAKEADAELGLRVIRTGTSNTLVLTSAPALARLATREGFDRTLHAQWSTAPAARVLRRLGKLERVAIAAHGRELL